MGREIVGVNEEAVELQTLAVAVCESCYAGDENALEGDYKAFCKANGLDPALIKHRKEWLHSKLEETSEPIAWTI